MRFLKLKLVRLLHWLAIKMQNLNSILLNVNVRFGHPYRKLICIANAGASFEMLNSCLNSIQMRSNAFDGTTHSEYVHWIIKCSFHNQFPSIWYRSGGIANRFRSHQITAWHLIEIHCIHRLPDARAVHI